MTSGSGTNEVFYLLLHFLDKGQKEKVVSFNVETLKKYYSIAFSLPVNSLKNLLPMNISDIENKNLVQYLRLSYKLRSLMGLRYLNPFQMSLRCDHLTLNSNSYNQDTDVPIYRYQYHIYDNMQVPQYILLGIYLVSVIFILYYIGIIQYLFLISSFQGNFQF